jgi:L-amino acid N-acyltransferase YncA
MIEKLKESDLNEIVKIYIQGVQEQIPPGDIPIEKAQERFQKFQTFVYKEEDKILGLVLFDTLEKEVELLFIYAVEPRKGIGRKLMDELINYAVENKRESIISTVSTIDDRVMKFYESCGFEKYGEYAFEDGFVVNEIRLMTND